MKDNEVAFAFYFCVFTHFCEFRFRFNVYQQRKTPIDSSTKKMKINKSKNIFLTNEFIKTET